MNQEKEWYQSSAVWGGLIALGAAIAGTFGIVIDEGARAELTDYAVAIAGGIGGLLAIYGRLKAEKQIKR